MVRRRCKVHNRHDGGYEIGSRHSHWRGNVRINTGNSLATAFRNTILACAFMSSGAPLALAALPEPPTPVRPDEASSGPGAYPNTTVTSGLFRVVSPPGVINAGSNQDQLLVSIPFSGPIPLATNRYNEGDFAVQASPFDVTAANQYLGTSPPWPGSAAEFEYKYESPLDPQTQVWHLNRNVGVVMATAAQNVAAWDDGIGDYHPTVALSYAASGFGYQADTGEWSRGGVDVNVGAWGGIDEGDASFAAAFIPYAGNWVAGAMNGPDSSSGTSSWNGDNSFGLPFENVDVNTLMTWTDLFDGGVTQGEGETQYAGLGTLNLSSVDASPVRGMLFTISTNGSSNTNVTAAAPLADNSGWKIGVWNDNQGDARLVAGASESDFSFLYIPFNTRRLVGAFVDGNFGGSFGDTGDFQITRASEGRYLLRMPSKTEQDGTLLLAAAGMEANAETPNRAHLSYEWSAEENAFVIESRGYNGTDILLTDNDFYFAWVDFARPFTLAPYLPGDVNDNDRVDIVDFGVLRQNFNTQVSRREQGDLNGDGNVNLIDFAVLRANFNRTTSVVPEPNSLLLLCSLAAVFLMYRRS